MNEGQSPESLENIHLASSNLIQPLQCTTVHQLDCSYYGEINKSYQKQGLGILQTTDFQTYFGFWKNGKADGKGFIIYPSGCIVYGHFSRNELSGPILCDDGVTLKVYVFENSSKINMAYEYSFTQGLWRLLQNVNTLKQTVVHSQKLAITERLPEIIAAEHSVYELIVNYLAGDFFRPQVLKTSTKKGKSQPKKEEKVADKYEDVKNWLLHSDKELWSIGLLQRGALHGLACKYNKTKMQLVQAGYYREGLLEGFAYRQGPNMQHSIGEYHEGMKHGVFYETTADNYNIVEYIEDAHYRTHNVQEETFRKRQKAFQYQQKDFLSAKNLLDFGKIKHAFSPTQYTHRKYASKDFQSLRTTFKQNKQKQGESLKKQQPKSSSPFGKGLPKTAKKVVSILDKHKISHTNLIKPQGQKTSLEIIRQKLQNMDLVNYEKQARFMGEQRHRRLLNSSLRVFGQEEEEEIAEQQNPFDCALHGKNLLNESPVRKMNGA